MSPRQDTVNRIDEVFTASRVDDAAGSDQVRVVFSTSYMGRSLEVSGERRDFYHVKTAGEADEAVIIGVRPLAGKRYKIVIEEVKEGRGVTDEELDARCRVLHDKDLIEAAGDGRCELAFRRPLLLRQEMAEEILRLRGGGEYESKEIHEGVKAACEFLGRPLGKKNWGGVLCGSYTPSTLARAVIDDLLAHAKMLRDKANEYLDFIAEISEKRREERERPHDARGG